MPEDSVRARVLVSGRVQGVFFRVRAAEEARALGVSGWVRNRPDGAVEAVFEGLPAAVEEAIAWCRKGPPHARVERADVSWERPQGETGFGIRG